MTYEFFEKRGKKVTRRWAGLKGEMEALRRTHMKARNPLFAEKAESSIGYRVGSNDFSTIQRAVKKAKQYARDEPGQTIEVIKWTQSTTPGRMGTQYKEHVVRRIKARTIGNPRAGQILFRTRAAAVKYAKSHGAKRFSVRKLRRA